MAHLNDTDRSATGTRDKDRTLARVRALLAKAADDSVGKNEADALTTKAAELMEAYGIDRAMAEHRERVHVKPTMRDMPIDAPYATAKVTLLAACADGFRCTVLYMGSGRDVVASVYGFEDDIELTVLLYTSLLLQMATRLKDVSDVQLDVWGGQKVRTRNARRCYILGWASSIKTMLAEATARSSTEPGTALVLRDRAAQTREYMESEAGHIRKVYSRAQHTKAFRQGMKDAREANLHNRPETQAHGGRAIR